MEVMPMATSPEFYFRSVAVSPYTSAPSSPISGDPFNYLYTSAPASPARVAAAFSEFSTWQNHAGEFSGFRELPPPEIITADRLFEQGWIRPLQPPSPDFRRRLESEIGRRRTSPGSSYTCRVRESRSLSPKRDHGFFTKNSIPCHRYDVAAGEQRAKPAKGGACKKWRLKDLLLFRSASEGRATGRGSKDLLRKYTRLPSFSLSSKNKGGENTRTTETAAAVSVRKGAGPAVSAHEMHYTANRAAANERRKKTPLPYQRHGLLGFLQFSPAARSLNRKI